MTNEEQNELLELLCNQGINAAIQPTKNGPQLRIFMGFMLSDWDHKSLVNHILEVIRK